MKRTTIVCAMIVCTTLLCAGMILSPREDTPVKARIVTVQRGDVHQVAAITGRLTYADEQIVYAHANGIVSQVCVENGQRVATGDALFRLSDDNQAQVASAYAANQDTIQTVLSKTTLEDTDLFVSNMVVRAGEDATVRQVYVSEQMPVAAGAPLARLTSADQRIICSVHEKDMDDIEAGQWAWISQQGEPMGFAQVAEIGGSEIEPTSGMEYISVVLMPDQQLDCMEGSPIDAEVYLAGSDDVLTLPLEAITERQTVWWIHDGKCTEISAEIVMTDEIHAWVNLQEGMKVAVGEFKNGQRVQEASE